MFSRVGHQFGSDFDAEVPFLRVGHHFRVDFDAEGVKSRRESYKEKIEEFFIKFMIVKKKR